MRLRHHYVINLICIWPIWTKFRHICHDICVSMHVTHPEQVLVWSLYRNTSFDAYVGSNGLFPENDIYFFCEKKMKFFADFAHPHHFSKSLRQKYALQNGKSCFAFDYTNLAVDTCRPHGRRTSHHEMTTLERKSFNIWKKRKIPISKSNTPKVCMSSMLL